MGDLFGNISHKAVARTEGIGWQGKSLLIVSPQYGPRIRLATVLTDMPLEPDHKQIEATGLKLRGFSGGGYPCASFTALAQ